MLSQMVPHHTQAVPAGSQLSLREAGGFPHWSKLQMRSRVPFHFTTPSLQQRNFSSIFSTFVDQLEETPPEGIAVRTGMFVAMKFAAPPSFDEARQDATISSAKVSSTSNKRSNKRSGEAKSAKKRRVQSRRPRPENTHTGRWTKEEHEKFLHGINVYGKEWKKIASMIETRTVVQIRTHAQKYFQKLAKKRNQEMKHADTATASSGRSSTNSKPKKSSRRSQKANAARVSSSTTVPTSPPATTKKATSGIPFKVSLNLSLQLPSEESAKMSSYRENSPTSVADLGSLQFMPNCSFGSDSGLCSSLMGDMEELPLSNWLNDVKMDSDTSDTCSLGSAGHDTIYVDTRYGLEASLEPYNFDPDDMFFAPSFLAE